MNLFHDMAGVMDGKWFGHCPVWVLVIPVLLTYLVLSRAVHAEFIEKLLGRPAN
jgi:hypothetical protein